MLRVLLLLLAVAGEIYLHLIYWYYNYYFNTLISKGDSVTNIKIGTVMLKGKTGSMGNLPLWNIANLFLIFFIFIYLFIYLDPH